MSEYYQFRDETGTPIDYYQLVDDNNELCKEIESLQQRIDKATKFIEMEVGIMPTLRGGYMARDELTKVGIGELYEILNGGENNK